MRKELVQLAIIGLGRQNQSPRSSGWEAESLLDQLPNMEPERELLLRAGVEAMYLQAGKIAGEVPATVSQFEPAQAESLPCCSPAVGQRLRTVLQSPHLREMCAEVCHLLTQAKQRIPPDVLPMILDLREKRLREKVGPTLGNRGVWLAQFSKKWKWAEQAATVLESRAEVSETVWEEGSLAERLAVLKILRENDPRKCVEWIQQVWKQEKAEARGKMLAILEHGLSERDLEFLEHVVETDRSANVRQAAATLLSRLPQSSYCQRMVQRTFEIFSLNLNSFEATPPKSLEKEWEADGISLKPPIRIGQKAWWLAQLVSYVPLDEWTNRFGSIAELFEYATGDWADSLFLGWTQACVRQQNGRWAVPLYEYWIDHRLHDKTSNAQLIAMALTELENAVEFLNPTQSEKVLLRLLEAGSADSALMTQLESLLKSQWQWSEGVSRTYLHTLRESTRRAVTSRQYRADATIDTMELAALRIAPSTFDEALIPFDLPESPSSYHYQLQTRLAQFQASIRLRKSFYEEIVVG